MLSIIVYYDNQNGVKESHILDVSDSTKLALTYQISDYEKPSAVKNGYSKTITFEGTKNNNRAFGLLYNMNANVLEYDPRQQVETDILVNGALVDSGYISLDKITISNGKPTYSCTFYSNLGQFFYNLQYSNPSLPEVYEKTLADLYYGFTNNPGTRQYNEYEERHSQIMIWDSEYIYNSWKALNDYNDNWYDNADSIDKATNTWKYLNVTAAPSYNGIHENFCSDTALTVVTRNMLSSFNVEDTRSSILNKWGKFTFPRDMSEFEMKDLRSIQQRPAIRYKMLLDAMFNPVNNGGFEVDFLPYDDKNDIDLVRAAYNNMFIIRDKINIDDTDDIVNETSLSSNTVTLGRYLHYDSKFSIDKQMTLTGLVDSSDWRSPALKLNIYSEWNVSNTLGGGHEPENMFTAFNLVETYCLGFIAFKITYNREDGTAGTAWKVALTCPPGCETSTTRFFAKATQMFREKYGYDNDCFRCMSSSQNNIQFMTPIKTATSANKFFFTEPINFDVTEINRDNPNIKLYAQYYSLYLRGGRNSTYYPSNPEWNGELAMDLTMEVASRAYEGSINVPEGYGCEANCTVKVLSDESADYESIWYDSIASSIQSAHITKDILFKNSSSPLSYLLSFTKMFNLKFRYNKLNKHIEIIRQRDFYDKNLPIIDVTDRIALDKSIDITHNFYSNKIINYSFEQNDNYLEHLYNLKTGNDYNVKRFDTANMNKTGESKLSDDIRFSSTGEYKLSSPYFTDFVTNKTYEKGSKLTLNYYADSYDEDNEVTKVINITTKSSDPIHKLCMFDSSNGSISGEYLAFFSGIVDFTKGCSRPVYYVTNNLLVMEKLCDNPCFLDLEYYSGFTNNDILVALNSKSVIETIGYKVRYMPIFSMNDYHLEGTGLNSAGSRFVLSDKYKLCFKDGSWVSTPTNGLYFKLPSISAYGFGYPRYTIYDQIFNDLNNDLYNKNTYKLTCYMRLTPGEDIFKYLRSLIYYNSCYFFINKITDYEPDKVGLYKVEMIKVQNPDNYR